MNYYIQNFFMVISGQGLGKLLLCCYHLFLDPRDIVHLDGFFIPGIRYGTIYEIYALYGRF